MRCNIRVRKPRARDQRQRDRCAGTEIACRYITVAEDVSDLCLAQILVGDRSVAAEDTLREADRLIRPKPRRLEFDDHALRRREGAWARICRSSRRILRITVAAGLVSDIALQ